MKTLEEILDHRGFLGNSPYPKHPHDPVCMEVRAHDGGCLGHILTDLQTNCESKLSAIKITGEKKAIIFLNWPEGCKLL